MVMSINCYSNEAYTNAYNNIIGINNALSWAYANGIQKLKCHLVNMQFAM